MQVDKRTHRWSFSIFIITDNDYQRTVQRGWREEAGGTWPAPSSVDSLTMFHLQCKVPWLAWKFYIVNNIKWVFSANCVRWEPFLARLPPGVLLCQRCLRRFEKWTCPQGGQKSLKKRSDDLKIFLNQSHRLRLPFPLALHIKNNISRISSRRPCIADVEAACLSNELPDNCFEKV